MKNLFFSTNKLLSCLFVSVFCCGMQMLSAMDSCEDGTQPDDAGESSAPAAKKRCKRHGGDFVSLGFRFGDMEGSCDLAGDDSWKNIEATVAAVFPGAEGSYHVKVTLEQYVALLEKVLVATSISNGMPLHIARIQANRFCRSFFDGFHKVFELFHGDSAAFFSTLQKMVMEKIEAHGVPVEVVNADCPIKKSEKCTAAGGSFGVGQLVVIFPCGHACCVDCFEQFYADSACLGPIHCQYCDTACVASDTKLVCYCPAAEAAPAAE